MLDMKRNPGHIKTRRQTMKMQNTGKLPTWYKYFRFRFGHLIHQTRHPRTPQAVLQMLQATPLLIRKIVHLTPTRY